MAEKARGIRRRPALLYGALGLVAAIAVVFGLDSVYGFLGGTTSSSAAQRTATVAYGTVQSSVSASGNVSVATSASADFGTSGTLSEVYVVVGDQVRAGQVMAKLDPTTAEASLEASQATLAQAESALAAAQAGPTAAAQATNSSNLEQAEAEVTAAKLQLTADEQAVTAAKKQLEVDEALGCPPAGSTSASTGSGTGSASSSANQSNASSSSSTSNSESSAGGTSSDSTGTGQTPSGAGSQDGTRNGLEIQAAAGPSGASGATGSTGASSQASPAGASGTTGATGATGTTSAAGSTAAKSAAPSVATGQASAVASKSASLSGTVDPAGAATSYWFEYGTSASSLASRTGKVGAGSGTSPVTVSASLTGLSPGRAYFFRLVASSSGGTGTGATVSFATLAAARPAVTTGTASNLLTETATLNGTIDPNGSDTTYYFEYGTTMAYGKRTPTEDAGSSTTATQVSAQVGGLTPDTAYLFRLVASNGSGASTGLGQVLKTSASSCVADQAAITAAEQAVTTQQQAVATAEANLASTQATITENATPSETTIAQDKAAVTQAQASVTADQKALDDTVLHAPVSGTVTAVNYSVGDTVGGGGSSVSKGAANASSSSDTGTGAGAGTGTGTGTGSGTGSGSSSSSSTPFATIETLRKLEVVSGFAEADATKLAVGQPATITFPALPEIEVAGKVTDVSSTSTVVSNVVTYNATIALVNPPADVKEGMTANVAVVTETREHVLELPSSAITTTGTVSTVQLVANGKTTVMRIQTGLVGDSSTEIVSGVSAGDLVAIPTVTVVTPTATGTGTGAGGTGAALFGGGGFGGGFGRGG
jgi:multidrug efflux pump subunit AcrA (membrane-fusion protein)